jgi:Holliday junction resolvasome RuvABC ATP-dependent DNA helicase subunit
MDFVGQKELIEELLGFVEQMRKGKNFNFLFSASSGYGKTDLASRICSLLEPDPKNIAYYQVEEGRTFDFRPFCRIQIIDEAHFFSGPEVLYQYMDSGKYIFFLLTNERVRLKEPLENRCIRFSFKDYSLEEITFIVKRKMSDEKIVLSDELCSIIAKESNLVPRVAIKLCERLINLFLLHGLPKSTLDVTQLLEKYLGVIDGLDLEHRKYLNYLKSIEFASLDTLCGVLSLDRNYIKLVVEPLLLKRGLITITGKGRTLIKVTKIGKSNGTQHIR